MIVLSGLLKAEQSPSLTSASGEAPFHWIDTDRAAWHCSCSTGTLEGEEGPLAVCAAGAGVWSMLLQGPFHQPCFVFLAQSNADGSVSEITLSPWPFFSPFISFFLPFSYLGQLWLITLSNLYSVTAMATISTRSSQTASETHTPWCFRRGIRRRELSSATLTHFSTVLPLAAWISYFSSE